jgi:hypothetical protein
MSCSCLTENCRGRQGTGQSATRLRSLSASSCNSHLACRLCCPWFRFPFATHLQDQVLASVVEHLVHLGVDGEELGVGPGLDALVLLRIGIPLARSVLELARAALGLLPRGLGPAVGVRVCGREVGQPMLLEIRTPSSARNPPQAPSPGASGSTWEGLLEVDLGGARSHKGSEHREPDGTSTHFRWPAL